MRRTRPLREHLLACAAGEAGETVLQRGTELASEQAGRSGSGSGNDSKHDDKVLAAGRARAGCQLRARGREMVQGAPSPENSGTLRRARCAGHAAQARAQGTLRRARCAEHAAQSTLRRACCGGHAVAGTLCRARCTGHAAQGTRPSHLSRGKESARKP